MPDVPEQFRNFFVQLRAEVLQCDGPNEGVKFESWCKENILKRFYDLEDVDIYHPGFTGQELHIDLAARKSDGMYLVVQAKWNESENGLDYGGRFSITDIEECGLAIDEIEQNPEINNDERTRFIEDIQAEHGENWGDYVQLMFICNTELANTTEISNYVTGHSIEVFSIAQIHNVQTLELIAESKPLDVRDWKFSDGVGFGIVRTKQLAEFVTLRDGNTIIKDQRLFNENLRFQLPNDKKVKEIKDKINETLENSPQDFLAMNNGILILGTTAPNNLENGYRKEEHSKMYVELNRKRDEILGIKEDMENDLRDMGDETSAEDREAKRLEIEALETDIQGLTTKRDWAAEHMHSIIFSRPSIANGGQTTSAMFDNYSKGSMENEGEVFLKFVCAPEDDDSFRHKIAVASNKQNPIEERDEVSNREEQRNLKAYFDQNPVRILFDHKPGLSKGVKENTEKKALYTHTLTPPTQNLAGIREITNTDYGCFILSTIGDIPHEVARGPANLNLFTVGHANYELAFGTINEHRLRCAIFGAFISRISDVMKAISNDKNNEYIRPYLEETNDMTEDQKKSHLQQPNEEWLMRMGFLNHWKYSLMNLCYRILKRIAHNHHGEANTILEGINEEQSFEVLLNLILSEQSEYDFHRNSDNVDRCWYKTKAKFTAEIFAGDPQDRMILIANQQQLLLPEPDNVCSEILPSLFALIRRIESVYRDNYVNYWSEKGKAFQNRVLLDACFNQLNAYTATKESVRERFGIELLSGEQIDVAPQDGLTQEQITVRMQTIHGLSGAGQNEIALTRLLELANALMEQEGLFEDNRTFFEDNYIIFTGEIWNDNVVNGED